MVFYKYTKEKIVKRRVKSMLDEEILELRRKLDESITKEKDYSKIYKLSVELDELITKHYNEKLNNKMSNGITRPD